MQKLQPDHERISTHVLDAAMRKAVLAYVQALQDMHPNYLPDGWKHGLVSCLDQQEPFAYEASMD